MMPALFEVEELNVTFGPSLTPLRAVLDVSFSLHGGETLCLVGESGSGKSVTALAMLGLLPPRSSRVEARKISVGGRSLLGRTERELARSRGKEISMIFQDPMSSLNPALTVGYQLSEMIRLHEDVDSATARQRSGDMLDKVRIPDAARRLGEYPHQLSGGMRQRVMIAMALACNPRVLIADEPTTALDVTVQAQILRLIDELKSETGTAVLFITHDFGVVAEMADRVAVMYAGRIVEQGLATDIFDRPAHGYTRALLGARLGARRADGRLPELPGTAPQLHGREFGCSFAPRCAFADGFCATTAPVSVEVESAHTTRCRLHQAVLAASPDRGGQHHA